MKKLLIVLLLFFISSCGTNFTTLESGSLFQIDHNNGPTLVYSKNSGVNLLIEGGNAFKDLNKNNTLDPYEDWQLSTQVRAEDLAQKLSLEEISGLMLYSSHQSIPGVARGYGASTYGGKAFKNSVSIASDLSDQQKKFLEKDHLRHVLITRVQSPEIAAQWNNNAQAYVESNGHGIPVNNSSDPRHESVAEAEYNAGAGGSISMWPSTLGLAAIFDEGLMREFGSVASREYRSLGISTALSPQIDLATEPRWSRFKGTLGEDPNLATDLARAYVEGFQATESKGWDIHSVNTMVKHWPGGGPEEGGRDGHFGYGAFAVYPGDNLDQHLKPFVEGAFKLNNETKSATAVMPYYTISDGLGEAVGNGYNFYVLTTLLREKYSYDGVICTDWGITRNVSAVDRFEGKPWGVENLTEAERHYKALMAGVDQFGGNNDIKPILEAYQMGVKEHGEAFMRKRFETSAVRLLKNIFNPGLFENPYLDIEKVKEVVGNPKHMDEGFNAQVRSVVMLKNQNQTLPVKVKKKVYIPKRYVAPSTNWWGRRSAEKEEIPFNLEIVKRYFEVVEAAEVADFALVGIESPNGGTGYDIADLEDGGNGYVPISLQYNPYTAKNARKTSLAGGSTLESFTNRSYHGKKVVTNNATDMDLVLDTKKKMADKPVVVVVHVSKPMIFSEIESAASAILIHMGVQDQAIMELLSGVKEPSALLPFQMPINMDTVETQFEDSERDMTPYQDSEGNIYDFAFGLNWNGTIVDERTEKYK